MFLYQYLNLNNQSINIIKDITNILNIMADYNNEFKSKYSTLNSQKIDDEKNNFSPANNVFK